MTKEEYLKELNKAFGDFKFFEENHTYTYKDKPISIGATGLIETYTQDFDAEAVAQKVAIKENKTIQEVLDEWKQKNEWACEKGHLGHCYVQSLWEGQVIFDYCRPQQEELKIALEKVLSQGASFYEDYRDRLELVANEYVIGAYEWVVG